MEFTFLLFIFIIQLSKFGSSSYCPISHANNIEKCVSELCFSHYYIIEEEHVERFDCDAENKIPKNECVEHLKKNETNFFCVHYGQEEHCCCSSSNTSIEICAPWRKEFSENYENWSSIDVSYFLIASTCGLFIFFTLNALYNYSAEKWNDANIMIDEKTTHFLSCSFTASTITLISIIGLLYFPIEKSCRSHENGKFITSKKIWFQVFEKNFETSLFFVFPIIMLLFQVKFYNFTKPRAIINRSTLIFIYLFIFLFYSLIFYNPLKQLHGIYLNEQNTERFCKYGNYLWNLLIAEFLTLFFIFQLFLNLIFLSCARDIKPKAMNIESISEAIQSINGYSTTLTSIEIDDDEMITVRPKPFHVPSGGSEVLTVTNNNREEWIALRVLLSTTGFYKVYPSNFFVPPAREISIEVQHICQVTIPEAHHNLLIEWFPIGSEPPTIDLKRIWSKPYLIPQNNWKFYALPIYLEEFRPVKNI